MNHDKKFIVAKPNGDKKEEGLLELCGIFQNDTWNSFEELKKYKADDLKLDQRSL